MARLNWCLAAVISWGKFLFACFFPLRGAKRDKVRLRGGRVGVRGGGGGGGRKGSLRVGDRGKGRDPTDLGDEFGARRPACLRSARLTFFNSERHQTRPGFSSCMKQTPGRASFPTIPPQLLHAHTLALPQAPNDVAVKKELWRLVMDHGARGRPVGAPLKCRFKVSVTSPKLSPGGCSR